MYKSLAKTLFVGKSVVFLPTCHSTNDELLDLAREPATKEGTIVITSNQISGKGQRGNSWEAEPNKNLTFSILLKPTFLSVNQQFGLHMAISLGILDQLQVYSPKFQVKWPNDLYFEDQKIGGILIQNTLKKQTIGQSIVGIGLNINQTKFSVSTATSLKEIMGQEFELEEIFEKLISGIEAKYLMLKAGRFAELKSRYLENLYWFGEDHLFKADQPFLGRIIDVAPSGNLEIETKSGLKSYAFKEVSFMN